MATQPDCEYHFKMTKEGENWCVCQWHECTDKCKDYQSRPLRVLEIRKSTEGGS